jgi:hypothetical protein
MRQYPLVVTLVLAASAGCTREPRALAPHSTAATASSVASGDISASPSRQGSRPPNVLGRIPVLEYHLIGDRESQWSVNREHFRRDLELLYDRGYRPITVSEMVDKRIDLPAGLSPVVFTFDDAPPSQFRFVERDGKLETDSSSMVGIWMDFHAKHPDWANKAVMCMLPAAAAGHAFFGEKGIDGQKSAWRFLKVRWLRDHGFELCDHTLWHANLAKYSDAVVQEQIARGSMAIDSAVPGYRVRTFALPLGVWPRNRALARRGSWTDPRTRKSTPYDFDAILEVAGGPSRSPFDPKFDPLSIPRVEVFGDQLEKLLDRLDRTGERYVSAGERRQASR